MWHIDTKLLDDCVFDALNNVVCLISVENLKLLHRASFISQTKKLDKKLNSEKH